ncbi:MAG TPA: O-antigen ligase family protein [Tissierellaceae bacterium]
MNFRQFLIFLTLVSLPLDQVFTSIFPFVPISPFRGLSILLAFYFIKVNVKKSEFRGAYLFMYCFILWNFISMFWASNQEDSLLYTFQVLLIFWFSLVCINELVEVKNIKEQLIFYCGVIGGGVSLLAISGVLSVEISSDRRLTFSGIGVNAVAISIGYYFIIVLSGIFIYKWSKFKMIILIASTILMFYFLLRTGTRSAIVGSFAALLISYPIAFRLDFKSIFKFITLIVIVLFGFFYVMDHFIEGNLSERIVNVDSEAFSENSRNALWDTALNYGGSFALGTGAGNEYIAFDKGTIKEAHNVFVSSFVQTGIIGVFLLVLCLLSFVLKMLKMNKGKDFYLLCSLILFYFIQMLKGSFLQTRIFWFPLIILGIFYMVNKINEFNNVKKENI